MNIKKFKIDYDPVAGKIVFDIDAGGITCHGDVDTSKLNDVQDLLYTVEESCQKIRRGVANKIEKAEVGRLKAVPLVPGHVYVNRGGGEFRCERITVTGTYFVNVKSGWRFKAVGVVMYDDGTIEWDYSTDGRFIKMQSAECKMQN